MSAAVIVANPLPAQLTAMSAELVARRDQLAAAADTVAIVDVPSLLAAEVLFKDLDAFSKQVKEDRLVLTRQIEALADKIRAVEKDAVGPLDPRRAKLAAAISAFRAEIKRKEEEAAAKARAEAERKAAELRRQQEEERQKQLAAWREEEERKKAEAAMFGDDAPAPSAPPPVTQAPVPVVPVVEAKPASVLPKSTVRTQVRDRLEITDAAALMAAACAAGGRLLGCQVLVIDEKAVDKLTKAGAAVPGARRVSYEIHGAAGAR